MSESEMSASLAVLRDIFLDPDVSQRDRMEAAEAVLTYESPPELVQQAKDFLAQLFDAPENPVGLRLEALKIMRKAEAKKVTQPTVTGEQAREGRELGRRVLIAQRRVKLWQAGLWPPPEGWADDLLSADFIPPYIEINVKDFGEQLEAARKRAQQRRLTAQRRATSADR